MYKALRTKQGLQFTVQEIIKLIADQTLPKLSDTHISKIKVLSLPSRLLYLISESKD